MISSLFSPVTLRNCELKNRVIAAPPPSHLAEPDGRVTASMLDYYHNLADTDIGMVIVEAAAISAEGQSWQKQLSLFRPEAISGLSRLVEKIRNRGALPVAQLYHGGINAIPGLNQTVYGAGLPRIKRISANIVEMKKEKIAQVLSEYAAAAKLAWNAGFSGIEIQAAGSSLPHQFLSPITNTRRDDYACETGGGDRFLQQLVRAVKQAVPDLLLFVCMPLRDLLPGGYGLSNAIKTAQSIKSEGVELFRVTEGLKFGNPLQLHPALDKTAPDAPFSDDTHIFRNETRYLTVLSGKVSTPQVALNRLKKGTADFVALGRTLNREPLWLGGRLASDLLPWQRCLRCAICKAAAEGCPDRDGLNRWLIIQNAK